MRYKTSATAVTLLVLLAVGSLFAPPAGACSTPVFRYALERWQPDLYGVVVFHAGPLDEAQQKALAVLKGAADNEDRPANLDVLAVDVTGEIPKYITEIWKKYKDAGGLPRVVALFPRRYGPALTAWTGPLTEANARALVDSPLRQKVYRQISAGATAVWVLVESGEKKKDDAAAGTLAKNLKLMTEQLELPPQPPGAFGEDQVGPPLKIAFPMVRVSRKDPAERIFIEMLLNTEEDLKTDYASEPMAFAVFGQGRAMWALVGKGINEQNIADVCAFLVGQCSCQVKEQNPGIDMLIAADWYAAFEEGGTVTTELPEVVSAPQTQPTTQSSQLAGDVALGAGPLAGPPAGGGGAVLRNVLIALGAVAVAALGLVLWASRKRAARA